MEFSTIIKVGSQHVTINVPKGSRAYGKANCVFCPLGPAHSEAWLLLTKSALDTLTANGSNSTFTIEWQQTAPQVANQITLTMPGWRLLQADRLLHGGTTDTTALYLAQFVDARYVAARTTDSVAIKANLRSYANNSDYLTGTSGYTWTSLLTELWTNVGVLGAFPGLPSGLTAIDGVPESTWLIGLNGWRALCAVLDQLDCAVAHNPIANTYSIVQLGGAQTLVENANRLKWSAEPFSSNIDCAANLRVYFYYHRKSYGQERDTELANNWAYNGAGDVKTVATGITGASGTKPVWDDLPWILDQDGVHSNNAACDTRANNRKSRYVSRVTVTPVHKIHDGLLSDNLPGGKVRAVLWRNWDDGNSNAFGGTVTEYICGPDLVNGFTKDSGGGDFAWFDREIVSPERETYAPPDYARKSFPVYPRLPNIVQINAASGSPGDDVSANADGFHKGRVRRWVANAMATLDDCWIRFVDEHDTNDGNVDAKQGDFFLGRLSGMSTSSGETLPVYLCRKGEASESEDQVIMFELAENLTAVGPALAFKLNINAVTGIATYGSLVIVHTDWYSSLQTTLQPYSEVFVGPIGCRGTGVFTFTGNSVDHYNIIWMSRFARFLYVETTGDYNTQDNTIVCKVLEYWDQGYPPVANPEQETVICHDPHGFFRRPDDKSLGIAVYRGDKAISEFGGPPISVNPPRYDLIWLEQICTHYTAKLAADLRGDIGVKAQIDPQTVRGMDWSLYFKQEEPFPNEIENPRGLMGKQGDEVVIIVHDEAIDAFPADGGQYQLLTVQQHPTWGWGRLLTELSPLGSAQARIWVNVGGTMTDTEDIPDFVFTDIEVWDNLLVSGSTLEVKTRIKWEYDVLAARYYVTNAACSADESDTVWGQ